MQEYVSTQRVGNAAQELRQLNEQLKGKIQSLEAAEAKLVSKYEGNSRDAFHTSFQKDIVQMHEFTAAIEKHAAVLQQNAATWRQKDDEAAMIAGK